MSLAAKKTSHGPSASQLLTLLEAARSMGDKRDLDDLLNYILEQCKIAMECDRCTIFLHDRKGKQIWSKVAMGEDRISLPEGTGIAGETISRKKVINVVDAYKDKRFNSAVDEKTGYKTKNILSVPMLNSEGLAVGCLQSINKGGEGFSEADSELALAFASQSAVAIESAILHSENRVMIRELELAQESLRQKIHQIETIYEIETIGHQTVHLSDFFNEISRLVNETMHANATTTLIEWDQGKWLYFVCDKEKKEHFSEVQIDADEKVDLLVSSFEEKKVYDKPQGDFSLFDGHLEFKVEERIVLSFSFVKRTQEGEQIKRRALIQIAYRQKPEASKTDSFNFLEVISTNITSIVEKLLDRERDAQSNRLATIGQLSGTIFHDFKNPMASIRGLAEIIGMSAGEMPKEKVVKFTDIIQTQVDRCVGMIGELLEFTRGEKNFHFDSGSLLDFLGQIESLLENDCEQAKVTLNVHVKEDIVFKFDKDRLMRVIFNLTNNAMEILSEISGEKSLTLEGKVLENGFIEISIADSGPGVPSHLQDTLFEVFVTHGKKNGTGLGLNIARQIVEGHGGQIDLDREYKKGARFVMTLAPSPSIAS